MKRFITFVSILLVIAMMTTLVACGGGNNDKGNGGGGDGTISNAWWKTTGELSFDDDGKVIYDMIDLRLTSIVTGADKAALENIVADFNAEYRDKINVVLTTVGQDSFDETVSKQIANKSNPPDLIMCHQKSLKAFADNKLLQPLNETITASKIALDAKNYSQGLSKYTNLGYTDYTFGMPADAQTCVVLVNKQILGERTIPETHTEFVEFCKTVSTELGSPAIAWSTQDDFFSNYVFNTALLQNGVTLYDEKTYKTDWYANETNRTAFQNALASIRDFTESSPACAEFGKSEGDSYARFYNNKALFLVCMPWNIDNIIDEYCTKNSISKETALSTNLGATSMAGWFAKDATSANAKALFGDSHFFAMSTTVNNIKVKAAACEFISYFTTRTDVAIDWGKAGHISANTIVSTSADYLADSFINNFTSKFYGDINNFRCMGETPFHLEVAGELQAYFSKIKDKTADDMSALKTAQDNVNKAIDFANM